MSRLQSVEIGNHLIVIYNTKEEKFEESLKFLLEGFQRNEVIMIITEDLTKDDLRERMRKLWGIDVEKFESTGDIIIKTTTEWYFPDGIPNIGRTIALWHILVENCLKSGKKGLRVVGDTSAFFKYSLSQDLLDYESALERKFNFPMTAICAYDSKDVKENLSAEQLKQLREHHSSWYGD